MVFASNARKVRMEFWICGMAYNSYFSGSSFSMLGTPFASSSQRQILSELLRLWTLPVATGALKRLVSGALPSCQ